MKDAAPCCNDPTGLGMNLRPFLESGRLTIEQVNAAELSPGNFAHRVRERVEHNFRGRGRD